MSLPTSQEQSTEGESKRLKQLSLALEKALSESQKQVNCHEAVSECYGENISIFASSSSADSNNNNGDDDARDMLANLLTERLQRIHERVSESFRSFLERNDLRSKLLRFEQSLEEYESRDRTAKQAEEQDKRSAQHAAEKSALPEGIKVEGILRYQSYRLKQEEKQKLLAEIASTEAENKAIEQAIEKKEVMVQRCIDEIKKRNESMARVADISSFSGS